ncbi:MAG: GNAT family N-acetyltransferase, partial [Kribbellaceae bacterium]|nr:GNAT family N-acetyltransferase [Kribbellaceae bacterium]
MVIALSTPGTGELGDVLGVVREWTREGVPLQLHPGDLGWFWRFGIERTAAAIRVWRRDGEIVAVGLLDAPDWLRMSIAPELQRDEELARQIVSDVPGVLVEGKVYVETPMG